MWWLWVNQAWRQWRWGWIYKSNPEEEKAARKEKNHGGGVVKTDRHLSFSGILFSACRKTATPLLYVARTHFILRTHFAFAFALLLPRRTTHWHAFSQTCNLSPPYHASPHRYLCVAEGLGGWGTLHALHTAMWQHAMPLTWHGMPYQCLPAAEKNLGGSALSSPFSHASLSLSLHGASSHCLLHTHFSPTPHEQAKTGDRQATRQGQGQRHEAQEALLFGFPP